MRTVYSVGEATLLRKIKRCPACGTVKNLDAFERQIVNALQSQPKRLSIYRGDGTDNWHVTYTRGSGPFPGEAVRSLVRSGVLVRTYPDCDDSYDLAPPPHRGAG